MGKVHHGDTFDPSDLLPPWMCLYVDEVFAHTHTHRRTHIHTHAHAHTNTRTYTHTYTHIYTHIHAHTHTHGHNAHTHTYTHAHTYMHIQCQTGGVCDTSDGALLSPIFDDFGQLVMVYTGMEIKVICTQSKDAIERQRLV